jgi:multisubunit Na+/H+ antiporter MnhB subunit
MTVLMRIVTCAVCAALTGLLGKALWTLGPAPVKIPDMVQAELHNSGVSHPVTAVLLNFRGIDTLLEVAVLLLALIGVLVAGGERRAVARSMAAASNPVLQAVAALTAPLVVLVAVYLLWAGAHQPGGAFQAAAVLAAGMVFLHISGNLPPQAGPGLPARLALVCGFLIFLFVAAWPSNDMLLAYPHAAAGALILLIESGLTLSLALVLAGLFLWLPDESEEVEQ